MGKVPVLRQLLLASTEAHDEARLRERLLTLIMAIWILLPRDPALPERLRALVPYRCDQLKWFDAEILVDALEKVAGDQDPHLRAQLVTIRLVVARLGGIHSAMRIGRLAIEELQGRCAKRDRPLP